MTTRSKRMAEPEVASSTIKAESDAGSEDMNELNEEEYEKERMENIKNNAALLDSLGLSSIPSIRPHEPSITKPKPKRSNLGSGFGVKRRKVVIEREPTRRSGRVAAMSTGNGDHKPDYNDDHTHITAQRVIKEPLIPKSRAPIIPGPLYEDEEEEMTDAPLPTREADGRLRFEGRWDGVFMPNVTPEEMFEGGAFGGGFFVQTHSRVLSAPLSPSLDTLPFTPSPSKVASHYTSKEPDPEVNRFKVRAGQSLQEWEKAGWIWTGDPRGWGEWYTRFWGGRRCGDDERQVRRWLKVAGPTGRFKRSLLKKVQLNGGLSALENEEIGAVLRQCLWQWGYELTEDEYERAMRGDE